MPNPNNPSGAGLAVLSLISKICSVLPDEVSIIDLFTIKIKNIFNHSKRKYQVKFLYLLYRV